MLTDAKVSGYRFQSRRQTYVMEDRAEASDYENEDTREVEPTKDTLAEMLSTGGGAEPICRCGDRSLSAVTKWLQLGNTRRMLVKVLQGSVFGPKLLTIHCIFATHHLKYDMYADDTQLYVDFPQNQPCHAEIAIRRIEGCTTDIKCCMTSHQLLLYET